MKKAIGYIRVSTAGQVEDGVSLDAQEAKIRAYALANDLPTVELYRDEGISGKRMDTRTGLLAAIEAAKSGDVLIAYSISRLSRSTRDMLDLADRLNKKGVDLVSLSEKIDTTSAAGKMVFRLMAVLAEFERDQISDRTKFALAHKRQRKEKTGGEVPYGYRATEAGTLATDQEESRTVALVVTLAEQGHGLRAICRHLDNQGITRRGGRPWHPQTIKNILDYARRIAA